MKAMGLGALFVLLLADRCILAQGALTVVSTPDYNYLVAPNSFVSMFAANIAAGTFVASDESPAQLPTTLGGVSATITDTSGNTLPIPLIAVTPGQINAIVPTGLDIGTPSLDGILASVTLRASDGSQITGQVTVAAVAPSLFTADQSGGWLAAAQVVTTHADGSQSFMPSIATCTSNLVWNGMTWSGCVPIPISLGLATDEVVLVLYGTGIRGVVSVVALCPNCGYVPVADSEGLTVLYAGPQAAGGPGSFYGLDQVNLLLPRSSAGSGIVPIMVEVFAGLINGVGGAADSNTVYVDIQ